jgi:hypothetical protein
MDIDLKATEFNRLSLFYGAHDITINNEEIENVCQQNGLSFQSFRFKNSAHNIFVDYDRDEINKLVALLLNNTFDETTENDAYEYKKI